LEYDRPATIASGLHPTVAKNHSLPQTRNGMPPSPHSLSATSIARNRPSYFATPRHDRPAMTAGARRARDALDRASGADQRKDVVPRGFWRPNRLY
jgi:hypothetical protein